MDTKKRGDFGFTMGGAFAVLIIVGQIIVDFVLGGTVISDGFLWLIRMVIYFVAGLVSANSQYHSQVETDDPLLGISNAGRGAAIIVCVTFWIYLIVRSMIVDDQGLFAHTGVVPSVCLSIVDFSIAVVLGSVAGRFVEKRHEYQN